MSDLVLSRIRRKSEEKKMDEVARLEEENEQACIKCATENGFTQEQADSCSAGEFNCKGCPWGGNEEMNGQLSEEELKELKAMGKRVIERITEPERWGE